MELTVTRNNAGAVKTTLVEMAVSQSHTTAEFTSIGCASTVHCDTCFVMMTRTASAWLH